MISTKTNYISSIIILSLLWGCGGGDKKAEEPAEPKVDTSAAVDNYYASKPDFFIFATPADIPADLTWKNGMDLPEFASPEAKKGGTMNLSIQDFPRTLRTVGPDSNGGFRSQLLDPEMGYASKHPNAEEYYPGLAQEWAIDWPSQTVYIRINPKATWSDGTKITADDALYAFYFFQSEFIQAPWYNDFYTKTYDNVTRYDEYTFSIKVTTAKPDMPSYALGLSPKPRHYYQGLDENFVQEYQWKTPPVTGAYILKEKDIKKGRSIALTRNDDWWAKDMKFWRYRYNPDKLMFTVIRNMSKMFESLKKGDIDTIGLNQAINWYERIPNDLPAVKDGYLYKTIFYNSAPEGPIGLWINSQKPLLDNKLIRQGIQYASNWELVIEKFFRGDYQRLNTTADGYGDMSHPTLKAREFSPEKAEALFKQAGFDKRGPDGILQNSEGQRLVFTVTTGFPDFKDLLTILKQEAIQAGLEFKIEVLDGTTAWKKTQEKNHEIALTGFASSPALYPRYWQTFHSENAGKPQTNNLTNTALPELDVLIDRYHKSNDLDEMRKLAYEIEEILFDGAYFVPGYKQPYYRCAYWRWLRFPETFNVKRSTGPLEYYLHWIDENIKKETLAARKSGKSFPEMIQTFDPFNLKE